MRVAFISGLLSFNARAEGSYVPKTLAETNTCSPHFKNSGSQSLFTSLQTENSLYVDL